MRVGLRNHPGIQVWAEIDPMPLFKRSFRSDRGASMVEYGLMVALVAVISVPAISMAGERTGDTFDTVGEALAAGELAPADGDQGEPDDGPTSDDTQADPGDAGEPAGDPGGSQGDDYGADQGGGDEPDDAKECDNTKNGNNGSCKEKACDNGNNGNNANTCKDDDAADDSAGKGTTTTTPPPATPTGSETTVSSSTSSFTTWTPTKQGGTGKWVASVEFDNDWSKDQYLTLEVTRTDEKGKTTTTTVTNFYVPAGGSATYQAGDNDLEIKNNSKKGVVSVQVKLVSVTSTDAGSQPVTYPPASPTVTSIGHPVP